MPRDYHDDDYKPIPYNLLMGRQRRLVRGRGCARAGGLPHVRPPLYLNQGIPFLCVGFWRHVCLTRVRQIVQELLRTRGSDQLQDADSSRIKVYVRKAGHLPDTMVGE